eukprot:7376275-Prymnesium_polylepis.1
MSDSDKLHPNTISPVEWLGPILASDPFNMDSDEAHLAVAAVAPSSTGELRALRGEPGWADFMTALTSAVGTAITVADSERNDLRQALLEHILEALSLKRPRDEESGGRTAMA